MSRRLENIQTGFVDYGKAAENLNQNFLQATKIRFEEDDRQRRIQQEEDARLASGAQLYAGWMDEVDKMENGLDETSRLKLVERFNEVKSGYRGLQEAISKGVKVGTPQYYELYNQINTKKKSVLEQIGVIKQINESIDSVVKNRAAGLITRPEVESRIKTLKDSVLNGEWKPSMGLITPQEVAMSSYKPAQSLFNSISNSIKPREIQDADYDSSGKKIKTTTRLVPGLSETLSSVQSVLDNSAQRDILDVPVQLNEWKSKNPEESERYKIYLTYMNSDVAKTDERYNDIGIKTPEEFNEYDYTFMEVIAKKYRPNAKEIERMAPKGSGKGSISKETQMKLDTMFDNIWSGDAQKRLAEIQRVTGALQTVGWKVTMNGNVMTATKGGNKLSPFAKTVTYNIDFSQKNPQNVSATQAMLKDYGAQVQGF
jgi:hypothetical protein